MKVKEKRQPTKDEQKSWSPEEALDQKGACFVSLKTKEGHLRGCIGTILSSYSSLSEEVIENAIAAASEDPRFAPVEQEELKNIVVSVDILSEPEKIDSENDLDPKRYGVIVSKGMRKGVLLPDLEGVDSVEKQLTIASQKAGIFSLDNVTIYRFTVQRFPERRD